tara:strand:- start:594 stop:719 length:126 start_codon:yes stop_codon:yes gene_type:complete
MPNVNGKKFPYTAKGKKQAETAKKLAKNKNKNKNKNKTRMG